MITEDIQSDESVPVEYDMTAEELLEFQQEYNQWSDRQDQDRPLYIWLK
jgi:hypothetical protein